MSVEQAILEQWGAYGPLVARVPEDRVWKGMVPQTDASKDTTAKPYVSLLVEEPESTRTSSNTYTRATLRMHVYAATEKDAERIANLAKEHFDGLAASWSRGEIIDCKFLGTTREEDEADATWWLSVAFAVQVQEARRTAAMR